MATGSLNFFCRDQPLEYTAMSAGSSSPVFHDCDAIVLRTIAFGEADLILHLFERDAGRISAISKGARSGRSKLGVRFEAASVVHVELRSGRGDLSMVRAAHLEQVFEHIRERYDLQMLVAPALRVLGSFVPGIADAESVYRLTLRMLEAVDRLDPAAASARGEAVIAAWELKLLHVAGHSPQLVACVRCGESVGVVAFSSQDGGVVCTSCRGANDDGFPEAARHAARWLLHTSLAEIAGDAAPEHVTVSGLRTARRVASRPMLEAFGFSARQ